MAVFRYGGSMMTTTFGNGAISFDADLLANSANNAETLVSYEGEQLVLKTGMECAVVLVARPPPQATQYLQSGHNWTPRVCPVQPWLG